MCRLLKPHPEKTQNTSAHISSIKASCMATPELSERGGIFLPLEGYPGMEIRIFDKLVIQSTIIYFANFSPIYKECLYKECYGRGGKVVMWGHWILPGDSSVLSFAHLYPAEYLEPASYSVNVFDYRVSYVIWVAQCKKKMWGPLFKK